MPAHRKPTNVLLLKGSFAHNPSRTRPADPKPRGPVGNAPRQTAVTFRKAWSLIVGSCPEGVLADRDRIAVELAASLFVEFRSDPAAFPAVKYARLQSLLGELGMTAAAASKVQAAPAAPKRGEFD